MMQMDHGRTFDTLAVSIKLTSDCSEIVSDVLYYYSTTRLKIRSITWTWMAYNCAIVMVKNQTNQL